MVALEAMERGRPVIASAVGGLAGDRRGRPHGPARPGRRRRGARGGVVELAGDPARAAAMGAAGRSARVEEFSQDRCTDRTDALYRAALAEAGAGAPEQRQARSSANAASSASTKSHGTR